MGKAQLGESEEQLPSVTALSLKHGCWAGVFHFGGRSAPVCMPGSCSLLLSPGTGSGVPGTDVQLLPPGSFSFAAGRLCGPFLQDFPSLTAAVRLQPYQVLNKWPYPATGCAESVYTVGPAGSPGKVPQVSCTCICTQSYLKLQNTLHGLVMQLVQAALIIPSVLGSYFVFAKIFHRVIESQIGLGWMGP